MLSGLTGRKNMKRLSKWVPLFEYGLAPVCYYSDKLLKRKHPPLYGMDMYKLFNNSKIVLNFHIGIAGEYAGNMRMFEVTGAGSCLLTDNKSNLSDLYEIGKEIVAYDNVQDCVSKAKWLLGNDGARKEIALAGQRRTLRDHTVETRCKQIIDIIKENLNEPRT
jgi:spore maturation protein CgeB